MRLNAGTRLRLVKVNPETGEEIGEAREITTLREDEIGAQAQDRSATIPTEGKRFVFDNGTLIPGHIGTVEVIEENPQETIVTTSRSVYKLEILSEES